eukprot:Platyproteum_vivax@DN6032_c0_g1_i1.p1
MNKKDKKTKEPSGAKSPPKTTKKKESAQPIKSEASEPLVIDFNPLAHLNSEEKQITAGKLEALNNEIGAVSNVIETSKKAREQYRLEQDAKFQDVLQRVEDVHKIVKEGTDSTAEKLEEFDKKIEEFFAQQKSVVEEQMDQLVKDVRMEIYTTQLHVEQLETRMGLDKNALNFVTPDKMDDLRQHVEVIGMKVEDHAVSQLEGENKIWRHNQKQLEEIKIAVDESNFSLEIKTKAYNDELEGAIQKLGKKTHQVEKDSHSFLETLKTELFKEVNDRFSTQARIVDNLTDLVTQFKN